MGNKRKTKIGIVTHYYQSLNFGGLLQAYALCRLLNDMGYDAEQICFTYNVDTAQKPRLRDRLKGRSVVNLTKSVLKRMINHLLKKKFRMQAAAMHDFGLEIPHSQTVYTEDSIAACQDYAVYITGSDQVWNLDWYRSAFFLEFVRHGTPKIAYAASLGHNQLSKAEAEWFREKLGDFSAVSVREKDAVALLSPLSPVPVEWLLDPTLLLPRRQWDEICADRIIHPPYLFCYFLGNSTRTRRLALQYANKRKLQVISMLHIHGSVQKCDMFFGDKRLYGISPKGFLSLIKYADYVFTDSFHAVVFSELYRKEYAVFRRDGTDSMASRIYSVTSIFEDRERFCDTAEKETLAYIEGLPPMEQDKSCPLLESMRDQSRAFLKNSLPNES